MVSAPKVGTLVLDKKRGQVGMVMDCLAGRVFLRAPSGGREWEAAPADVQPAGPAEELRYRVKELNEHAGGYGEAGHDVTRASQDP